MTDNEFFAYLAGVADSDGSFSIIKVKRKDQNCPYYGVQFALTWVKNEQSKAVMDKLVGLFGGSYCTQATQFKTQFPNARPYLKYCAVASNCEHLTKAILPFLLLKRKQARNILRLRKFTRAIGGGRGNNKNPRLNTFSHNLYLINRFHNNRLRISDLT